MRAGSTCEAKSFAIYLDLECDPLYGRAASGIKMDFFRLVLYEPGRAIGIVALPAGYEPSCLAIGRARRQMRLPAAARVAPPAVEQFFHRELLPAGAAALAGADRGEADNSPRQSRHPCRHFCFSL